MRPKSIIYFESIMFGTLALGVVQTFLGWDQLARQQVAAGQSIAFILFVSLFSFSLVIGLTLLVSRRKNRIAKWISIGMFALGLPTMYFIAAQGLLAGSALISVAQTIGQFLAYALLFTPTARAWMKGEATTDTLKKTFS